MAGERFDRVTEPQRECLRLVLRGHNSKEIALALHISPFTVDKRISRGCAALGVTNRFEAARMLAAHEGDVTYQSFAYQPSDVAQPVQSDMLGASEELASAGGGFNGARPQWLPIRSRGERYNTLTPWQRLAWIGMIPAALAVAVGMLGFGLSVVGKVLKLVASVMS